MRSPSKADSSVPILKSMRTKRHRLACPSCESVTYGLECTCGVLYFQALAQRPASKVGSDYSLFAL